jgi:hypothetical protein
MLAAWLFLLQCLLTKGDEVPSIDDEFGEASSQSLPETPVAKNDESGENELYRNLSVLGKLYFQLLRSGDISGK